MTSREEDRLRGKLQKDTVKLVRRKRGSRGKCRMCLRLEGIPQGGFGIPIGGWRWIVSACNRRQSNDALIEGERR
jgi:hypothetical protein